MHEVSKRLAMLYAAHQANSILPLPDPGAEQQLNALLTRGVPLSLIPLLLVRVGAQKQDDLRAPFEAGQFRDAIKLAVLTIADALDEAVRDPSVDPALPSDAGSTLLPDSILWLQERANKGDALDPLKVVIAINDSLSFTADAIGLPTYIRGDLLIPFSPPKPQ